MKFSVGQQLRVEYGPDNPNNRLFHIVAIFSDNDAGFLVVKHWSRRKRRWLYRVLDEFDLHFLPFPKGADFPREK